MLGVDLDGSDGSSLLTLDAASVQTAPDGYRRIVWMIIGMIKAHPMEDRMAKQAAPDPPLHLRCLDPVQHSHALLTSARVLALQPPQGS
jgi:hypothetical protein